MLHSLGTKLKSFSCICTPRTIISTVLECCPNFIKMDLGENLPQLMRVITVERCTYVIVLLFLFHINVPRLETVIIVSINSSYYGGS